MTPFQYSLAFAETFTKACLETQSAWVESITDTTRRTTEALAPDRQLAFPARSWYRKPAPTWSEVATSYGWPTPFSNPWLAMWTPFNPMPAAFSSMCAGSPKQSFDPMATLTQALEWQSKALQMMMMPLQSMSTSLAPDRAKTAFSDGALPVARFTTEPNSDTDAGGSQVAVASITLPDSTTFKITLPLPQGGATAFWPWAASFGASNFATPPAAFGQDVQNSADRSIDSADKELAATLRRSYLRSRH